MINCGSRWIAAGAPAAIQRDGSAPDAGEAIQAHSNYLPDPLVRVEYEESVNQASAQLHTVEFETCWLEEQTVSQEAALLRAIAYLKGPARERPEI